MIHKYQSLSKIKILAQNKRAFFDYFIYKEFEAGISLHGWEVKSIRYKNVNISNSYIVLKHDEAYLVGTIIQPTFMFSSYLNFDPIRSRKLLLKKNEIKLLANQICKEGYTIIALSIYLKDIWIKVKIGIAQGKKKIDKRMDIKKREWKLDKIRMLKKNIKIIK